MSLVGGLQGYPYIDEPDDIGQLTRYSDDGVLLWTGCTTDERSGCEGDPAINIPVIQEFRDLVRFADSTARARSRHLIIATMNKEAIYPSEETYFADRAKYPGYFYNTEATELMNTLYNRAEEQSWLLGRLQVLYPGKQISQIMNFFDSKYGCRNSCTESAIISQVVLNKQYSSWHWFYQGECIHPSNLRNVGGYNSVTQWNTLLNALNTMTSVNMSGPSPLYHPPK